MICRTARKRKEIPISQTDKFSVEKPIPRLFWAWEFFKEIFRFSTIKLLYPGGKT